MSTSHNSPGSALWWTELRDAAEDAFWARVAARHPEIKTGDFPPDASFAFSNACGEVLEQWHNSPILVGPPFPLVEDSPADAFWQTAQERSGGLLRGSPPHRVAESFEEAAGMVERLWTYLNRPVGIR